MRAPGAVATVFVFLLLCLIWGTTWSVIEIGLRDIPPFFGVAVRFALSGLLLLALVFLRRLPLGRAPHERSLWLANGLLSFAVPYGIVYWSEQWIAPGLTAVLFSTYPLFVAVLGHFALPGERVTRSELAGGCVALIGVAVIYSTDFRAIGGEMALVASVVMLFSPLSSAMGSIAVKRWGRECHPISVTAVPMLVAALLMGALSWPLEADRTVDWNPVSIASLLYLVIFGSAVTFTLYYWLLAHQPVKRMALIAYVVPVVAVAIGVGRGEALPAQSIAGSALVIGGVAWAVQRSR